MAPARTILVVGNCRPEVLQAASAVDGAQVLRAPSLDEGLETQADVYLVEYQTLAEAERSSLAERFSSASKRRLVLVSGGDLRPALAPLFQREALAYLVGWAPGAPLDLEVTLRKALGERLLGLEPYLGAGATYCRVTIRASVEKNKVLDAITAIYTEAGAIPRLGMALAGVGDEFVTNAIYNAPIDAQGQPRHAHLSRSVEVQLEPGEEVEVVLGHKDGRLGVMVRDPFGTLAQERVFSRLAECAARQGNPAKSKTGGAGLGLYFALDSLSCFAINVVPGVSTEMVGLLDLQPTFRQFAAIHKSFSLSYYESDEPAERKRPAGRAGGLSAEKTNPADGGPTEVTPLVLVVDDSLTMRMLISGALKGTYRVELASDGEEGLVRAKELEPDLIISDVTMPRKNGLELCAAIKEDPTPFGRTPVILVSAQGELNQKLSGLERGADDYLIKPINTDELLARSRNLVRMRTQEKQLLQTQLKLREAEQRARAAEQSLAQKIQASILPASPDLEQGNLTISGRIIGAEWCTGDFWTYRQQKDKVVVVVADVTGHGLASAMVTELAYGALLAILRGRPVESPSEVLAELNAVMCEQTAPLWISMVMGVIDPQSLETRWSSAGHPPVLHWEPGGPARVLAAKPSSPLGFEKDSRYEDQLTQGPRRFFAYSDGVIEAESPGGSGLGLGRLARHLTQLGAEPPRGLLEGLEARLVQFTGGQRFRDDVTMVQLALGPR